jgi:hypothetical protein
MQGPTVASCLCGQNSPVLKFVIAHGPVAQESVVDSALLRSIFRPFKPAFLYTIMYTKSLAQIDRPPFYQQRVMRTKRVDYPRGWRAAVVLTASYSS